jgi:hypothetical protein
MTVWFSLAVASLAACATPGEQMRDLVRSQAMGDLGCDAASLSVTQLRPTQKVVDGRRGKVERTSYSAKGCGDYRAYVVECVRGNCRADPIIEDPYEKQQKQQHSETGAAP